MQKRRTKQKAAIYNCLMQSCDHPSASDVYEKLLAQGLNLSLATCYRNLNELVEEGLATSIIDNDNVLHFDYNRHDHCHTVCRCCGKISDVDLNQVFIEKLFQKDNEFNVDMQNIILYGICKTCEKEKGKLWNSKDQKLNKIS